MAYAALRLRGQPAAQVGIRHRRERVVLHPAFAEKDVIDEKVALKHGPPGARKGRANDDLMRIECVGQRVGDRADITFGRGVKS